MPDNDAGNSHATAFAAAIRRVSRRGPQEAPEQLRDALLLSFHRHHRRRRFMHAMTAATATLAIAGIFPFAGFFSKDEILWQAWSSEGGAYRLLWLIGVVTAFMTAFYMFRLMYLTFWSRERETPEVLHHVHESPRSMTVPLIILAFFSLFAGFLGQKSRCECCALDYSFIDSGDGPAVFVIMISGFIVVGGALAVEMLYAPPFWVHAALWVPLVVITAVLPLRLVKGILIALQYHHKAAEGRLEQEGQS